MRRISLRNLAGLMLATALLTGGFSSTCRAQAFPDLVQQLGIQELARNYLYPGADAVGNSLNSGLFHTAKVETGFHIWAGVKLVWTFVPETDRSFDALLPAQLLDLGYPTTINTATIFGDKGATLTSQKLDPSGKPYPDIQLPGGVNLRNTFIAIPHVTIGSLLATEIMVRGIPNSTYDTKIGKISFVGLGVKHSFSQYINLPFDLAVMAAVQQFKIGDFMDVSNFNTNVHASIPMGLLTVFGGVGYEKYDVKVSYTYTPTGADLPAELKTPHTMSLDFRRNNYRFSAGAALSVLPILDVTAEYCFGIQDNLTLGAGFKF